MRGGSEASWTVLPLLQVLTYRDSWTWALWVSTGGHTLTAWKLAKRKAKEVKTKQKKDTEGVPGWLRWLGICLWLRSWLLGPGIETHIGFPAQQRACFPLPLCLSPPLILSKMKKEKKKKRTPDNPFYSVLNTGKTGVAYSIWYAKVLFGQWFKLGYRINLFNIWSHQTPWHMFLGL